MEGAREMLLVRSYILCTAGIGQCPNHAIVALTVELEIWKFDLACGYGCNNGIDQSWCEFWNSAPWPVPYTGGLLSVLAQEVDDGIFVVEVNATWVFEISLKASTLEKLLQTPCLGMLGFDDGMNLLIVLPFLSFWANFHFSKAPLVGLRKLAAVLGQHVEELVALGSGVVACTTMPALAWPLGIKMQKA